MKELTQSSTKGFWIATGLITLSLTIINISYGIGYGLGIITSLLSLKLLVYQIDQMMFYKKFNAWIGIPFYILKSFLFVIPMVAAILWPNWINLFAAVAGLLSPKLMFYISELLIKKESHG